MSMQTLIHYCWNQWTYCIFFPWHWSSGWVVLLLKWIALHFSENIVNTRLQLFVLQAAISWQAAVADSLPCVNRGKTSKYLVWSCGKHPPPHTPEVFQYWQQKEKDLRQIKTAIDVIPCLMQTISLGKRILAIVNCPQNGGYTQLYSGKFSHQNWWRQLAVR